MHINELKIGDRVKIKKHGARFRWDTDDMKIEYIGDNYVTVTKIPDKFTYGSFDVEKKYVVKTINHPYPVPETTYHCPKCDKKLWGLCGMPIKQYTNEPCQECKDKESPSPKSFSFDFRVQSMECKFDSFRKQMSTKMIGIGEFGSDELELDLVLPYNYKLGDINIGKTYTVEIKEKE